MENKEKKIIEKKMRIYELLPYADNFPEIKFLDLDSNEMLDEKIEVLEAIKSGKNIKDIPKFYDVLELMPKDGTKWD